MIPCIFMDEIKPNSFGASLPTIYSQHLALRTFEAQTFLVVHLNNVCLSSASDLNCNSPEQTSKIS
ncbi:hypothetical protein NPIL_238851, partial [Nephila pilipes]